ncbi:hypothetical protein IAG44_38135 [Streptomyces roseirectus]|uniref:Integral membrane protein n=1 Tax=Streptomyces roseirectus TaxID=2768066 RepID=A0A7H0IPI5_9ACTN|nr:hypothetical protein [Streptomyces roseirectus]QNP74701.1 hypothetical protein IAG44_38135 [Streptomyces roseirectus]
MRDHPALRQAMARPNVLFGGVYGAVLASSVVAALTSYRTTESSERLYDAKWLLVTAFAAALSHGYAHLIARRGAATHAGLRGAVRVLLAEWPLLAATLPTVVMLLGAGWGWWRSSGIEYVAFGFNITLLFGWGVTAVRAAGRSWRSALAVGCGDAALGVIVVVANAVIK